MINLLLAALVSGASLPLRDLTTTLLYRPSSWEINHDSLCRVNDRAFTGIRVLHERTLPAISAYKTTVITECLNGLSVSHLTLPSNETIFERELELMPESHRFQLVRRPAYRNSTKLKYIPGTVVGGVYTVPANSSSWEPVMPLVADSWSKRYYDASTSNGSLHFQLVTTLLRSPDRLEKTYPRSLKWAEQLDPSVVPVISH